MLPFISAGFENIVGILMFGFLLWNVWFQIVWKTNHSKYEKINNHKIIGIKWDYPSGDVNQAAKVFGFALSPYSDNLALKSCDKNENSQDEDCKPQWIHTQKKKGKKIDRWHKEFDRFGDESILSNMFYTWKWMKRLFGKKKLQNTTANIVPNYAKKWFKVSVMLLYT